MVAELRGLGLQVVDLSADFRLRDADDLRALVRRRTASPSCSTSAVYGLTELNRERIRGAELVANPGCYPTAALLALAPLAEAGLIDDVVDRRQVGRLGGRAGRGRRGCTSSTSTRTSRPTGSTATATRPRSQQELRGAAAPTAAVTFVPHLLPLDQGELVELLRAT